MGDDIYFKFWSHESVGFYECGHYYKFGICPVYYFQYYFSANITQCARKAGKKDLEERAVKIKHIKTEMDRICLEGKAYIMIIPEMYRYPLATTYLCQIIETGRAETMKEALNLLEEQLHRWRLEQQMTQILQNQQKISREINA